MRRGLLYLLNFAAYCVERFVQLRLIGEAVCSFKFSF